MSKYKIAWMPGDGIGVDVMDAARLVLDRLGLDAEYVPAEIGWELWRQEGDALPARTIEVLKTTTCALVAEVDFDIFYVTEFERHELVTIGAAHGLLL